jgi:hypothetical protein
MSIRSRFSIADNAFPTSQFIELGAIRFAPSLCDTRRAVGGSFRQTAKMADVSIVMSMPNNTIVQLRWQEMNYWWSPVFLTAELASAIASRCKATEVRRYPRTYGADYKTVLRLAQPQVKVRDTREVNNNI